MGVQENRFQARIKKELKALYPGCIVTKNDPNDIQGIPDLELKYGNKWLALEVKASADAPFRPNQEYYIDKMNEMSFARVIYPENKDQIFDEIYHFLKGDS